MKQLHAVITGISAYAPDYILTNDEISKLVDTSDEWITTRVGIKERRILKGEAIGVSFMGTKAVADVLLKTDTKPDEVEVVIFATTTPDHPFPSAASMVAEASGIKNAFCFDMQVACSGFVFGLEVASNFIKSGKYKKILLIAGDKMSSITNYSDRNTSPLFGDAVGAVMLEPTEEKVGVMDAILRTDGVGYPYLQMKAGGSKYPANHSTIDNNEHTVYQEGKVVFKYAVSSMADVSVEIVEKNNLSIDDLDWFVPHQANMRIIEAARKRLNIPKEKVMVNIQKYGNTSAGTIPMCLWEWEDKLKKGDNVILTAFGAGFSWGAIYLKWGYDTK
ncbi:MAG: ketoacyl-ACP synthase III [Dysgonamonadaceae bacterium]|nr:ketoacyl-ACP synthase III [Dysgonamonadaceae bacterium]MDD4727517.1 ketoacyl-ACP synthase III [Dysgonamonadaceae bacterium]